MTYKVKTISCFVISAIGWLVYLIGMLYKEYSTGTNEFSPLVDMVVYVLFTIVASLIHLFNCIYATIFLIRKAEYRMFNVLGLLSSVLFVILFSIPILDFIYLPSDSEESPRELDVRWVEYTKEHQAPAKEFQLNESLFGLIISRPTGDRKILYSSTSSSTINCLDLYNNESLWALKGHLKSTQSLSFSHDGKLAISGGDNGEVIFWDVIKGIEIARKRKHEDYIRCVACSPVDNLGLSGGELGDILLWDLNGMEIIRKFSGHTSGIRNGCLVWGAKGKRFISGSWDGSIRLWDVNAGQELVNLQAGYGRIMSLDISSNGKFALSSYLNGPDQPVILWDLENQKQVNRFGVPGNPWHADQRLHVESVCFSSDGNSALFGLVFGTVIWWNLENWEPIKTNRLFDKELIHVSFADDNSSCYAVGSDNDGKAKIKYWKLISEIEDNGAN